MSEERSSDLYDVVDSATTVHGGRRSTSLLNKDITLAVTDEPLEEFCIKMELHARALQEQMSPVVNRAIREHKETKEAIKRMEKTEEEIPEGFQDKIIELGRNEHVEKWNLANIARNSIYGEVTQRLAYTRSRGGRLFNSLTEGFKGIGKEDISKEDKAEDALQTSNVKGAEKK